MRTLCWLMRAENPGLCPNLVTRYLGQVGGVSGALEKLCRVGGKARECV